MLAVWSFFYGGCEYCVLCVQGGWPVMVFNAQSGQPTIDHTVLGIAFDDEEKRRT